MVRKICSILCFTVVFSVALSNHTAESQTRASRDDLQAYSSIAPPFLTPAKNVFVTREGDQFVLAVTATCLLEDVSDAQFELLSSSPAFVHVSDVYRKENTTNGYAEALGLVYVTPQIGDAGKYEVSLQVKACTGKVERVITFKVRVRPARPN